MERVFIGLKVLDMKSYSIDSSQGPVKIEELS
jgi:hypothetical protein